MLQSGPAIRVIIHLNEDTGSRNDYLHRELISFLFANEVSGATVIPLMPASVCIIAFILLEPPVSKVNICRSVLSSSKHGIRLIACFRSYSIL
jgi:hypothetical protein